MPLYGDFCVRLQNAARARIRSVPVQATKDNLSMAQILLQQGFIYNVTRGTLAGPSPATWNKAGIADRRLWIDLKYRMDERPVLGNMSLISKPSRRLVMDTGELLRFATGRRAKFVKPLTLGEIGLVNCGSAGWFEVKDAIQRGLGGELVARAS
ncbi:ribosomal protein S8 [Tilletiaria anomala UBC 951]|uniref:Ribosomal protein S8 n=1 Tax=Tilletiaria anomala (strain ATCC 24038 / CBS 436.72 / UBC 951) TaxID=1037660 RepID=A0A066VPM4_TILAU|nr:ribosomal protein S8 [Tilletiaria anomala UBC 951]KDN40535.1 ribosomal protein S8 [Tilletiaria anomala UBC 951]